MKTVPPFTVRCLFSPYPVLSLTRLCVAVAGGDTCDAIASAHKVNTTLLHENNPQIDPECSNIYIGEVLCVASKVIVPPPADGKSFPTPSGAIPPVSPQKTPEPTKTPEPPKVVPAPPKTPEPVYGDDNDDDEDLPWCDEL